LAADTGRAVRIYVSDVVDPAVWLASSGPDFVNDQVIFIDGGIKAVPL
jgi:gluconate 5-dehydrogenase